LEKKCRTWARRFGNVHIVTGPIIGKNIYGSIGRGRVTVPDAFFKAILVHDGSRYHSIAFIMENKPLNDNLQQCAMSVDELESKTGFDLFPALEDSAEEKTEREFSLRVWKL
jgi:endonuclease G